jgi:hypothetical protein
MSDTRRKVYACRFCQLTKVVDWWEEPGRCRCGSEWEHIGYEEVKK